MACILIKANGGKVCSPAASSNPGQLVGPPKLLQAFCAGGDVKGVVQGTPDNGVR